LVNFRKITGKKRFFKQKSEKVNPEELPRTRCFRPERKSKLGDVGVGKNLETPGLTQSGILQVISAGIDIKEEREVISCSPLQREGKLFRWDWTGTVRSVD